MKIKSLLIGSVAAAGLATGAHAADLAKGVMTSLDVCDALGLSGLTISSDTNCLAITGSVSYMFAWGDYTVGDGNRATGLRLFSTPDDNFEIPIAGDATGTAGHATDWDSQMIAWLQATASQDSDFGVAKAVIKLKSEQYRHSKNGYGYFDGDDTGGSTINNGTSGGEQSTADGNSASNPSNSVSGTVIFDQAYVSVGDSTVLTAGKTGTIINTGDDTPLNWLGLFNSDNVGTGVLWSVSTRAGGVQYAMGPDGKQDTSGADIQTGGASIQIASDLGNGLSLKAGLEDLQDPQATRAGTAAGVISYAGENLTAHLSLIAAGVLDGDPDVYAYHGGFTGTFDKFKISAAIAGDSSGYWDGLATAQATFDMFKIAGSVEGGAYSDDITNTGVGPAGEPLAGKNFFGAGASATLAVSDGVSINIGGRYFDQDTSTANTEGYQGAVAIVAALTETLTLEGDLGVYGTNNGGVGTESENTSSSTINGVQPGLPTGTATSAGCTVGTYCNIYYGAAQVTWAPGGGFTSSLKGEAYSNGAYRATFNASKAFQ